MLEKEQKKSLSTQTALKSYEGWAWWFFAVSTALAPLGPVVHYTGWSVALVLLLLQRFLCSTSLRVMFPGEGKLVIILALALTLWSAAGSALTATNFSDWGRGVSFFAELVVVLWLTARLNQHERDRKMLLRLFVWGALLSALYFTLQELSIVAGINKSLRNGNSLGLLGLLISMFLWNQSLASNRLPLWARPLLFTLGGSVLFLSFSSGAWLAGAFQFLVILRYSCRLRRTARWIVTSSIFLAILSLAGLDYYSDGRTRQLMFRELSQMTNFSDFDSMTTSRKDIWLVSLKMIRQHPITGNGQRFEDAYKNTVTQQKLNVKALQASHPHNTWFFVLYQAGIPGFLMLAVLAGALLHKSWRIMNIATDSDRCWALLAVVFLVGQLFYSTNGDLFQGRRDVTAIAWALFGVVAVLPAWRQKAEE